MRRSTLALEATPEGWWLKSVGVCYAVWYSRRMVSKSSAVRSIRLPNAEWEWLVEEAAHREVTVNGLVADLLLVGRLKAEVAKATAPGMTNPRSAPAIHVDVPVYAPKAFNPRPKAGK